MINGRGVRTRVLLCYWCVVIVIQKRKPPKNKSGICVGVRNVLYTLIWQFLIFWERLRTDVTKSNVLCVSPPNFLLSLSYHNHTESLCTFILSFFLFSTLLSGKLLQEIANSFRSLFFFSFFSTCQRRKKNYLIIKLGGRFYTIIIIEFFMLRVL